MDPAAAFPGYGPLLLLGLAIFNCVTGNGNATTEDEAKRLPCSYPNGNCTDGATGLRLTGHFSECPEKYKYYCIKGRCRYIAVAETPSCVCESGYTGARCEMLDLFYLRGDKDQIVVICLIAVMVALIVLIASACVCIYYYRERQKKRNEEEMRARDKGLPVKNEDIPETHIA